VEEHLVPAVDLALQPCLKGVPLAQEEAVHVDLAGLRAKRGRPAGVGADLAAWVPLLVYAWFPVPGHEKRLLTPPTLGIPRSAGPGPKVGDPKKRPPW
jgi:hypothetical protein